MMPQKSSSTRESVFRIALLIALGLVFTMDGAVTVSNWIGGSTAAGDWANVGNWDNGVPSGSGWEAVFGSDNVVITANQPGSLTNLVTGTGTVDLPAALQFTGNFTAPSTTGSLTVGAGGLTVGGAVTFQHSGTVTFNGNFTAPSLEPSNIPNTYIQNAGVINVSGTFGIKDLNGGHISDWDFGVNSPGTIKGIGTTDYIFDETVTFAGGHRPNWNLLSLENSGTKYDLNGKTLTANTLRMDGISTFDWHGYLVNSVAGGTIDANVIQVATSSSTRHSYLDLANTTVTVRGAGTAWQNNSTDNVSFDLTSNTTVVFDPAAGTLSIDTGSQDRGGDGVDLTDWDNNFAFDLIQIGDGDTITLTGTDNVDDTSLNALYARTIVGLGAGGIMNTAGHQIYLTEMYSNVTFDDPANVFVLPEPGSALLSLCLLAGFAARRPRRMSDQERTACSGVVCR